VNLALATISLAPALAVGSFVNVVAARVPLRLSVVRPRSACPGCGAPIAARDNVPVISYIALRGRCRHCRKSISLVYPAVEALTTLLVATCFLMFGASAFAVLAASFVVVLITLSAADVLYRLVPNRIVVPAAGLFLFAHTALAPSPEWLLASIAAAAFLLAAALAYPRGLGMGDVKLALLLGAMLGLDVAPALFVGFVAALVPAAVLFARHGTSARKIAIPLVPFLSFGAVVALFWGDALLGWYAGLFGG
jgi:leader peptidase (prepilin peptidase) / N-methyltransferase